MAGRVGGGCTRHDWHAKLQLCLQGNLLVTDIIATNTTSSMLLFRVFTGGAADCGTSRDRLFLVGVPPSNVVHVPLVAGIGFSSGQRVCLNLVSGLAQFNFRGFLFTPS